MATSSLLIPEDFCSDVAVEICAHILSVMRDAAAEVTEPGFAALQELADSDDLQAQFRVASCHATGTVVPASGEGAEYWFWRGAKLGDQVCQCALGMLYEGDFADLWVRKSRQLALYWLEQSAWQGNERAMLLLARRCGHDALRRDDESLANAARYWLAAATCWKLEEGEEPPAMVSDEGWHFARPKKMPYPHWYSQPRRIWRNIAVGSAVAEPREPEVMDADGEDEPTDAVEQLKLANRYLKGSGVEKDVNKAIHWFKESAKQGNASAAYGLGLLFYRGSEIERNCEEALRWFTQAAEQGYASAQHVLGFMYCEGQGTDVNKEQGVAWFEKGAEQGHARAQYCLGECLEKGEGVPQDSVAAFEWMRKAEQGHAKAQFKLGLWYGRGFGVTADDVQANTWYELAAEQGHRVAQYNLGLRLEKGKGAAPNPDAALKWYRKAAEQGHVKAQAAVERITQGQTDEV